MRVGLLVRMIASFVLFLAVTSPALFLAYQRSPALAVVVLLAFAVAPGAILTRIISRHLTRIDQFALRIGSGQLPARPGEISDPVSAETAQKLDRAASYLEARFQALESRSRELEAMLDSMQEAVIAVDAQGRTHWTNAVMERIAGPVRLGSSLVQTVRDPSVLACAETTLEKRSAQRVRATSVVPGRIFDVNAAPTPGGGAVIVLHDITEVERVQRTLRDFIANVSHELRTPLTSIAGYVETLFYDERSSGDTREFLDIILRNATRMRRLIEDLLALARVESGEARLRIEPVPAKQMIDDAIALLNGMVRETGVSLVGGVVTDRWVLADADAMQQVFSNLIENAVKYGGAGKQVTLSAIDRDQMVEFSVEDCGPGMASEHLDRIFERFYRVDKARSRESGGTGLGLAIAKQIMRAQGGAIRAESELGRGSTFYFTLPLAPAEATYSEPEGTTESNGLLAR